MTTTTNDITAFQVGRTYSTRSICDNDCIFSITVESRTACFITTTCGKRLKVSEWDGAETVAPEGRYSMCPTINASRETEASRDCWAAQDDKGTMIHGENGTSLAAIFQYLALPSHPFHARAVEQAAAFVQAERNAEVSRNQKMMRNQMQHISESDWSRIVD